MDIIFLLLRQNAVMFCYLLAGWCLSRKKLISAQGSSDIGKMLLYLVMPMAILKSYMKDFSEEMFSGLLVSILAAFLSLLLAILISSLVFKNQSAITRFGAAFSNAGFMGIPLVQMVLGEDAVFYTASFVAILNILQWTYGVFLITGERERITLKKVLLNPIVLSFTAGILLFLLPVELPRALTAAVEGIAAMNAPLAMIVLGIYLASMPLKELFTDKLAYRCAGIRLLLIPLCTIILLMLLPGQYRPVGFCILIAASAPVGSNAAIFAGLYGKDYKTAVKEVCLSTLLCIATMPLMVGLAELVW